MLTRYGGRHSNCQAGAKGCGGWSGGQQLRGSPGIPQLKTLSEKPKHMLGKDGIDQPRGEDLGELVDEHRNISQQQPLSPNSATSWAYPQQYGQQVG